MDPLTSWLLLLVVGVPWAVGVTRIVRAVATWCDRLDRVEPLYVGERTRDRLTREGSP